MRVNPVISILLLLAGYACALGCKNNPFVPAGGLAQNGAAATPAAAAPAGTAIASNVAQAQQALNAQLTDLNRRISQLDANNRDLHTQLAQSDQARQQLQSQIGLLQKQLAETTGKIKEHQIARSDAEKRVQAIEASTRIRGGATLTANSNLKQALSAVQITGLEVRQEADVVRIELPVEKLFAGGTPTLTTDGSRHLDDVAAAIARSYPRQRIVIEGHTDNATQANPSAAHAATATQAGAVFQHLVTAGQLKPQQLSILAMGGNHPRASNATPQGQAENRRIEIVVYPDAYDAS